MEETNKNDKKTKYHWRFQPGNPGGPGRPKGSKSLKVFAREYLESLPDEDKIEYLKSLPEEIVWKMAEGNPHSTEESKTDINITTPILVKFIDKDNKPNE